MSLVSINWTPTDRQLRQFAVAACVALPILAGIWSRGNLALVATLGAAGALAIVGWLSPQRIRPLFLAVTLAMLPFGIVIGEIILVVVYFGLFFAVGGAFRLIGRDSMTRTLDRRAATYWSIKPASRG